MTVTETPGIPALLVSWTTPVMLPRSDCAKEGAGVARAAVASVIATKRLIAILASRRSVGASLRPPPHPRNQSAYAPMFFIPALLQCQSQGSRYEGPPCND